MNKKEWQLLDLDRKLAALKPWARHSQLEYQSCRYCHRSGVPLWKYSVRSYICDEDRDKKMLAAKKLREVYAEMHKA